MRRPTPLPISRRGSTRCRRSAGTKLGVRIGFHHGPVLQRDDDVFGDTVNLAARLVAQAKKGEIILSTETAALLGPVFAPWCGSCTRSR